MRYVSTILLTSAAFLLAFAGLAHAQNAAGVPDGPTLYELAKPVLEALTHGQYAVSAALALVFVAAAVRKYGTRLPYVGKWFTWTTTDEGGTALVFLGSIGGAFATAVTAGSAPSLALLWMAVKVAFAAAGGYTAAKRLAVPLVEWLAVKSPEWAHPLFDLVLWVFGRSAAVAKAEKAGADAVASSPATGAAGAVGERRDLE